MDQELMKLLAKGETVRYSIKGTVNKKKGIAHDLFDKRIDAKIWHVDKMPIGAILHTFTGKKVKVTIEVVE